jgi:hypothetical protein
MERGRAPTPEEGYPVEWEVLKAGDSLSLFYTREKFVAKVSQR